MIDSPRRVSVTFGAPPEAIRSCASVLALRRCWDFLPRVCMAGRYPVGADLDTVFDDTVTPLVGRFVRAATSNVVPDGDGHARGRIVRACRDFLAGRKKTA